MTKRPKQSVVVAVTADDDRFRATRLEAQRLAAVSKATLLLYDWDAPTLFGDPLPTWWSGEGSEDLFGRRLDATQLKAAGRAPIARQVREAENAGITAGGWLPSSHGPDELARYAREQSAEAVVVPADLAEVQGLEALLDGTGHPVDALAEQVAARVVVVG